MHQRTRSRDLDIVQSAHDHTTTAASSKPLVIEAVGKCDAFAGAGAGSSVSGSVSFGFTLDDLDDTTETCVIPGMAPLKLSKPPSARRKRKPHRSPRSPREGLRQWVMKKKVAQSPILMRHLKVVTARKREAAEAHSRGPVTPRTGLKLWVKAKNTDTQRQILDASNTSKFEEAESKKSKFLLSSLVTIPTVLCMMWFAKSRD